jgi:D-lyxose ketol-isomerase
MVVSGVVHNQDLATPARSVRQQMMEEGFESHGVKCLCKQRNQLAPAHVHRPKQSDGLSRGRMPQDRVRILRGHPHDRSGPMLLEVAFIQAPQVYVTVGGLLA